MQKIIQVTYIDKVLICKYCNNKLSETKEESVSDMWIVMWTNYKLCEHCNIRFEEKEIKQIELDT